MAINKVVYGNDTLVDLTEDSVTESTLFEGETAHNAAGEAITGTAKQGHVVKNATGTAMTQRADLQFTGNVNVSDDSANGRTVVEVTGVSDNPTFTEASTRANIASGESFSTILGKIKKWFSDVAVKNADNRFSTSQHVIGYLIVDSENGTASSLGASYVIVGNNIAQGTEKNTKGVLRVYAKGDGMVDLDCEDITGHRYVHFPDKNGTLALTSDVVQSKTVTLTTDSNGKAYGSTYDLIGVSAAHILGCYFERDSYNAVRQTEIGMYGAAGYYIAFFESVDKLPIANSSVTVTIFYIA